MVESKPYQPPEGNESKIPTERNNGIASNTKNYIVKDTQNKPRPEPKSETYFQGRCTDL